MKKQIIYYASPQVIDGRIMSVLTDIGNVTIYLELNEIIDHVFDMECQEPDLIVIDLCHEDHNVNYKISMLNSVKKLESIPKVAICEKYSISQADICMENKIDSICVPCKPHDFLTKCSSLLPGNRPDICEGALREVIA